MRRGLVLPFALVLSLALAAGLTELYDGLEAALGQVRLENPAQAVNALNRAQSLLREEGALPPVLRDAALTNLQEARQFVAQKSAVDPRPASSWSATSWARPSTTPSSRPRGRRRPPWASAWPGPRAFPRPGGPGPLRPPRRPGGSWRPATSRPWRRTWAKPSPPRAAPRPTWPWPGPTPATSSSRTAPKAASRPRTSSRPWPSSPPASPSAPRSRGSSARSRPGGRTSSPRSNPPLRFLRLPRRGRRNLRPPPSGTQASPEAPSAEAETFYTPGWMDERTAQTVRLAARTLGYNYDFQLLEAVEEVRDEIGLAVTALGRGDAEEGRYRLERAFYKFRMQVEPVFVHIHPSLTEAISRSLNLLSQATGIRTLDALTAYEAVEALRQSFLQGPRQDLWLNLKLALLQTAGVPRAVFFLLAGALSFFPLYLLRLTFGGRNVYWNLLGLAFLVLLLPIFAEALSYFGSILADYGNLPALAFLSNLSIGQGLLPYLAWGFTIFLVVALAGAGLRGIAAQFGLLREREPEASGGETTPTLTSETIVEWDEEF